MTDKINLILDLDNTLISSVTMKEFKKIKNRKLKYKTMENYYQVYMRPHLSEFLKYAFNNFNVSIWTAASRDYAMFIIEHIILDYSLHDPSSIKKRKLKMILYDDNCDQSQKYFDKKSPKDLRYLYNFQGYYPCNTIIMDDLPLVYKANSNQTIRAPYFDALKSASENDEFLKEAIIRLEKLKKTYDKNGCTSHIH